VDRWVYFGFAALTLLYAAPLLADLSGTLPHDAGDPALNAWILLQSLRHAPLTDAWLNPPVLFPATGVMTYSEHLLGLLPFAWPVAAVTGSPVAAYNVIFLLSFFLSAAAACWLVRDLTGSVAGGIVAGLAYGFAPHRSAQLAHLQVLASFWMPVVLVALRRYVGGGGTWWLAVFAAGWLLQVLTNGHFIFFFGIVVGAWLVWHASRREHWRRGAAVIAVWVIATGVVAFTYWPYRAVHERYGMTRSVQEIEFYSAPVEALSHVTADLWLWGDVLPHGEGETELFPGLTLCLLIVAGLALRRRDAVPDPRAPTTRRATAILLALAAGVIAVVAVSAIVGPWRASVLGISISVTELHKPLTIASVLLLLALVSSGTARRAWRERSPVAFFLGAAALCWLLAQGPTPTAFGEQWLDPAPYRWLMLLPGVTELRVPTRIWMPATLLLAAAAGTLWAFLMTGRPRRTIAVLTAAASLGLLAEGWVHPFHVAPMPPLDYGALAPRPGRVVVEVPFGDPGQEVGAMFRATLAGLPTANGFSGHDPPHLVMLRNATSQCDLDALDGLAGFGDLSVIADTDRLPDDCMARLVERASRDPIAAPGKLLIEMDRRPLPASQPGRLVRPALVTTSINASRLPALVDDDLVSRWDTGPQEPGEWLQIDLGNVQTVSAVELSLGQYLRDYPRVLVVEGSIDGEAWAPLTTRRGAPLAFQAAVDSPRVLALDVRFEPARVRHLRLTQTGFDDTFYWSVAELRIRVAD
jgi:hypothetical protein